MDDLCKEQLYKEGMVVMTVARRAVMMEEKVSGERKIVCWGLALHNVTGV